MPHIVIEYPAAFETALDVPGLVETLHAVATATDLFPRGGIRTFARPAPWARVGDGKPENGFVQVNVRIAPGRTDATKASVARALFEAGRRHLAEHFARGPFALQLEVSEFDARLTVSANNMIAGHG